MTFVPCLIVLQLGGLLCRLWYRSVYEPQAPIFDPHKYAGPAIMNVILAIVIAVSVTKNN
jgi:hypothetical protein